MECPLCKSPLDETPITKADNKQTTTGKNLFCTKIGCNYETDLPKPKAEPKPKEEEPKQDTTQKLCEGCKRPLRWHEKNYRYCHKCYRTRRGNYKPKEQKDGNHKPDSMQPKI